MSIDDIGIDHSLFLHLILHLLILNLRLLLLFLHFHFLLLNNSLILRILVLILILIDGDDFVHACLTFQIEVGQSIGDVADIYEVIFFDLLAEQGFSFCALLCFWVIAFDDGEDFISDGLKYLWRLILNHLIDLPQIFLINLLVLLGLGPVVQRIIKLLLQDVAAFVLPFLALGLGLPRGLLGLVPRGVLAHGGLVDLAHQGLHFLKILFTHNYKRMLIMSMNVSHYVRE